MKFLREKRLQKCVSVVLSAVMLSTVFVGSFASSQSYGESVTIEENVLENDLSKESVLKTVTNENVWSTSDFTFSGTTLTGLSEAGVVKLETNKDLVIPNANADGNAIETIGAKAFYSKGINSVKLPDSVKTISMAAFSKNNITNLYIPSSVKKIDRMGFFSNSISNLEIANDVQNLEILGYAFRSNSLKSVNLPYGVTTVGSSAFASNTGIDENPGEVCLNTVNENHIDNLNIYVKDGMQVLKFVGWSASDFTYDSTIVTGFSDSGNEKLTNDKHLVLPLLNDMGQKITSVGRTAFANCGLKSVIIPTGVSKFVVDASAFSSNEISRVVLPEGVINLEATSFESNQLESVKFPSTVFKIGNASFRNNNISNIEISPKVFRLQMDGNAFASNNVKSVDLPISIEKLTKSAFYENPGVDEMPGVVYMYTTNPKNFDNSRLHYMDSPIENNKSQYQNLILKQVTNKEVVFAKKLSNKEVGYNVDKENLELPSSIDLYLNNGDVETVAVSWSSDDYDKTVVGHYNFKADYVLPDGVLGEKPEVNLVVEVVLPDEIPEDMRVWNNNDFIFNNASIVGLSADGIQKAKVNKDLVIPDKNAADEFITEIKAGAFNADNIFGDVEFDKEEVISVNGFKTIKLPSNLEVIADNAFQYNNLISIDFPETLKSVGTMAFNGNKLEVVSLPDSVLTLGKGAFGVNKLKTVKLSSELVEIPAGVFSRNIMLTHVDIPDKVKVIGESAFSGCPLASLELPKSVERIEKLAFIYHKMSAIKIPGNVKFIGEKAFAGTTKGVTLKSLTLDNGVESIGKYAFEIGLLKSVKLPSSVKYINPSAFNKNTGMKPFNNSGGVVYLFTKNKAQLNLETSDFYKVVYKKSSGSSSAVAEKNKVKKETLKGNDRYETAVKISESGWNKADNVVLINGYALPDALSATPFAKIKNAPILPISKNKVNSEVLNEMKKLNVKNVYLVGGENSISDDVKAKLKEAGYNVTRISGNDRYETSLKIADLVNKSNGKNYEELAFVNGRDGLVDAISIASVFGEKEMPIVLTNKTATTKGLDAFLKANKISKSYVIGGTAVMDSKVLSDLPNYSRLSGNDRKETNAKIIEAFYKNTELKNLYITKDGSKNQNELVDALSVGVVAAKEHAPVMIVSGDLNDVQKEMLKNHKFEKMTKIGGNGNEKGYDQAIKMADFN